MSDWEEFREAVGIDNTFEGFDRWLDGVSDTPPRKPTMHARMTASLEAFDELRGASMTPANDSKVIYITNSTKQWRTGPRGHAGQKYVIKTHSRSDCGSGLSDYYIKDKKREDNTGLVAVDTRFIQGLRTQPCSHCNH